VKTMVKALPTFLIVSTMAGMALLGLVLFGAGVIGSDIATSALVAGSVAGFLVSTCGWVVVLKAVDNPTRMIAWFGAGLMTKMVLLALAMAVLILGLGYDMRDIVGAFATVFLLLGFVQLVLALKSFGGLTAVGSSPATGGLEGQSTAATDELSR